MQKNGYLSIHFFEYYFQNFIENEPRPTSKNLRHSSLDSNVFNTYVKFQVWVVRTKGDMHFQKIKLKNIFSRYVSYYLR